MPAANIIALPMPTAETISWHEFIPEIWEPLMARLVADHWIDAIPMDLFDHLGRRKYAVHSHRIAALVTCRGVPLRIADDPALYRPVPPFTDRPQFRTNAAAVDAELALLPQPNHPINAFVLNPLFQNAQPTTFAEQQVIKVSRLDGPTAADAMALVDRAIAAEKTGVLGRAYLDLSDRDPLGNRWLEACTGDLNRLGFDPEVERSPATMPVTARFDAPVLYFGWYAANLEGAFALPGFRFPPGAIVLHIHSYSAATLRSTTSGWAGPLVARGVTATFGNVFEPYLQLTHRPNLLVHALAGGADLVDAAYFALEALSWQEVVIGDPLYRPFAVPLRSQLRELRALPSRLAGYAVLREVHRLEHAGRSAAAVAALRAEHRRDPSLEVGFALAERLSRAGDRAEAAAALEQGLERGELAPDDWALANDAAALLAQCGQPVRAIAAWDRLFAGARLPPHVREDWLRAAAAVARSAGEFKQAEAWQQEAAKLSRVSAP